MFVSLSSIDVLVENFICCSCLMVFGVAHKNFERIKNDSFEYHFQLLFSLSSPFAYQHFALSSLRSYAFFRRWCVLFLVFAIVAKFTAVVVNLFLPFSICVVSSVFSVHIQSAELDEIRIPILDLKAFSQQARWLSLSNTNGNQIESEWAKEKWEDCSAKKKNFSPYHIT